MPYSCPDCGSKELLIAVTGEVNLTQDGPGDRTAGLQWNDASVVSCTQCDASDRLSAFTEESREAEEEEA